MKLAELLAGLSNDLPDLQINGLSLDSRNTKAGDVFIALNGAVQHGLKHAQQAIEQGAVAIIYEPMGVEPQLLEQLKISKIALPNLLQQLGEIAARFYHRPSQQLAVIGITGTNGKTTCSQLLAQALTDCSVIGTLGWGRVEQLQPTANTTPDALAVQQILRQLVDDNQKAVAMEVSSHGLTQGRVNGVAFTGAVFTNLSRDHLDYHGTMAAYLAAKLQLFSKAELQFAVVNLDDRNSVQVLDALADTVKCWGFSLSGWRADHVECVVAENIQHHANGISFSVRCGSQLLAANTALVGQFNLQNIMAVLCVLLAMDWPLGRAIDQLATLKAVNGRMEKFGGHGQPTVLVDYAHTPDALEKVLQSAKSQGQLWTVFGCGGNRDPGKRPQMGRIAETWADHVIVTDDNPRNEAPSTIINDILTGCQTQKVSIINDRQTAITTVIQQAAAVDCIVIAGKGHESYQEINGVKWPFSDQDIVKQALAKREQQA